jgi:cytochrome b
VLSLLLFRMVWGFAGSRYARFSALIHKPSAVFAYLKGDGARSPGHNPIGSLSVLALLAVLLTQAVSGLFANDDIASEGPLVKFISKEWSDQITWWHADVLGYAIYVLIGMHVAAILYYALRRGENLTAAMLSGDKDVGKQPGIQVIPADDSWPVRMRALCAIAACAGAVYALVTL